MVLQLRERLALLKMAEEEEEEQRRQEIVAAKQVGVAHFCCIEKGWIWVCVLKVKDQFVMDTLDEIAKHRAEQTRMAAARLIQIQLLVLVLFHVSWQARAAKARGSAENCSNSE